jgi:hypothetical protein
LGLAWAVDFLACQEFLCFREMKVCRYVKKTALQLRRGSSGQFLLLHGAHMGKEGNA